MKTLKYPLMVIFALVVSYKGQAHALDTVVIELNNKSKIIIYTEDRAELEKLEQYDLNKLIKDLNSALGSSKMEKMEIKGDGKQYLKDTTIIIGHGGAKTKIRIGKMELLVDTDDWSEFEDEFDEDLPVKKRTYEEESIDRTRHYFNIDFGLNNWLEKGGEFPSGANYAVKPWGSWYIALNSVNSTWISGPLFMDWGLGVSWYNWKMENSDVVIRQQDNRVEFTDHEGVPNIASIKSKLTAPYVNITLVPMLDFAKGRRKVKDLERGSVRFRTYNKQGIRFGVGGYVGYRLGGHSKFVYKEDGNREKDKEYNSFYLSNFRYGVRAQIGFKGLDLFAMYDLNEVFSEGRGPAGSEGLNAITFGITL